MPTFLRLETQILNPDRKISNRTNCVQISHTASQRPDVYFKAKKLEIETILCEKFIFQFIVDFLVGNVSKSITLIPEVQVKPKVKPKPKLG